MKYIELKEYPPMMDVNQAAEFMGVGKSAIYKLAKQGGFPAVTVAGKVRVLRDKLFTWLEVESSTKRA